MNEYEHIKEQNKLMISIIGKLEFSEVQHDYKVWLGHLTPSEHEFIERTIEFYKEQNESM